MDLFVSELIKKHNIEYHNYIIAFSESFSPEQLKRNKFPNSVLDLVSDDIHTLSADNLIGVIECIKVLEIEFLYKNQKDT